MIIQLILILFFSLVIVISIQDGIILFMLMILINFIIPIIITLKNRTGSSRSSTQWEFSHRATNPQELSFLPSPSVRFLFDDHHDDVDNNDNADNHDGDQPPSPPLMIIIFMFYFSPHPRDLLFCRVPAYFEISYDDHAYDGLLMLLLVRVSHPPSLKSSFNSR